MEGLLSMGPTPSSYYIAPDLLVAMCISVKLFQKSEVEITQHYRLAMVVSQGHWSYDFLLTE